MSENISNFAAQAEQDAKTAALNIPSSVALARTPFLPGVPISTFAQGRYLQADTGGVTGGSTSRMPYNAVVRGSDLMVAYGNFRDGGVAAVGGTIPTTQLFVRCAVDLPGGQVMPLFCNGQKEATLDGNGIAVFTCGGGDFAAGDVLGVRTFYRVTTNADPVPGDRAAGSAGMWYIAGDSTRTAGTPGGTTNPNQYRYGPIAVMAGSPAILGAPRVVLLGDSITAGQGDSATATAVGFGERAADAAGVSRLNLGIGGMQGVQLIATNTSDSALLLSLSTGGSTAVVTFGTNDFINGYTGAQIASFMATIATLLRTRGYKRIILCTIPPRSTSTDGWVTVGNQTKNVNDAVRTAYNGLVRAGIVGFDAYKETADTVESSRDSGLWKASFTADGTHPNSTGHVAMAATFTAADFV